MAEQDLLPSNREQRNEAQQWPLLGASLGAQMVKRLPTMRRPGFNPWDGKSSWRSKWQPTSVFLPGKSHGGKGLVGYSPQGRKKSARLSYFTHFNGYC